DRLREPRPLEAIGTGAAFSIAATVVNFTVARVLLRVGRKERSLATEADGRHLMTDVWTTLGVIAGVALAGATGQYWLDPTVAILVAFNILREGWGLVRRSLAGLMDSALPDAEIEAIEAALRPLEAEGANFAELRTRGSGP